MKYKKAILSYPNSKNLGDYIQSIAAKKFIDEDAICIDREKLNTYNGDKVKLIMNGWFMQNPNNWPPSNKIKPLFISFHINPTAKNTMLSEESIKYFKKHQPIGCRDIYTKKILASKGIKSYFSGCLTITITNRNAYKKEGILVLSALDRITPSINKQINFNIIFSLNFLIKCFKAPFKTISYYIAKKRLNKFLNRQNSKITFASQIINKKYSEEKLFSLAQNQLNLIAKSELVITSRIHTALPAISLGTKVIFILDGLEHPNQRSRIEGLSDYFFSCRAKDLLKTDFKKKVLKKDLKVLRSRLIEKATDFFNKDDE
tara:strand:- start:21957 stop:22907 length:951 start_codon:yes stop_codon:yes gene_type:complete